MQTCTTVHEAFFCVVFAIDHTHKLGLAVAMIPRGANVCSMTIQRGGKITKLLSHPAFKSGEHRVD